MEPSASRDRTAVVLAAGSPWGRLLAGGLARLGWSTVLVDAPGEELEGTREHVLAAGGTTSALPVDWGSLEDLLVASRRCPADLPSPSLLVHPLPPPVTGPFATRDPGSVVEETLRGYASLVVFANRLVPAMAERSSGRIIVIGSAAARAPLSQAAVHSALAGALPPFTTSLRREVRRQGIEVSYLEPTGFPSPPLDAQLALEEGPFAEEHRRFLVSDASLAHAFVRALHEPHERTVHFRAHGRSAPSPSLLRRYLERELHGRHPQPPARHSRPARLATTALRGRIAVVTGSSRGIGRSIAVQLARHGMRVVLTGRDTEALARSESLVREAGGEPRTLALDLTAEGAPDLLRAFTQETWGVPDLVVNNAGLGFFRRLERQDDRQLRDQLQVDLLALLAVSRSFLPPMLEQGRGHLMAVGSMAAEVPLPRLAPYSGIKGAVKGFSLALDREVAHRGLHVSDLEPTTVDTEFIRSASEPGRRDVRQGGAALRLLIIPPEVVGRAAESTVLRPRSLVMVPRRVRILRELYRAGRPLLEGSFELPRPSGVEQGPPIPAQ